MKRILARGGGQARRLSYLVGFLACAGLAGCARPQAAPAPKGPPEVEVSLPVSQKITDYEEFSGRLEANRTIQIKARVTGYLLAAPPEEEKGEKGAGRYFKEGDDVQKGQLLFKIDPLPYAAALARAKAGLVKAKAAYEQAARDWNRAQTLGPNSASISREEYDKFKGVYEVAKADVKVAEAQLKIDQVNMDYTEVRAPIAGKISRAMVDPGNLVKADETVLTGIGAPNPIKAYFDVDERTVLRIVHLIEKGVVPYDLTGTRVEMGLADEEDRPHKGTIDFYDTFVDVSTGTLRVRGTFPNPSPSLLAPGMFVRVRLPIGKEQDAVLIAEKALVTDQGQKYVYVVKNENEETHEGEVKYQKVKLGRLHQGLRVIKEGLSANEKVVVSGLQRVRPDIKVKLKEVPMPVSVPGADALDPSKPKAAGLHSAKTNEPPRRQERQEKPREQRKGQRKRN